MYTAVQRCHQRYSNRSVEGGHCPKRTGPGEEHCEGGSNLPEVEGIVTWKTY